MGGKSMLKNRYTRIIALALSLVVLVVTAAYARTVEHVVKAQIPAVALNPQKASDVLIDPAPYLDATRNATKGVKGHDFSNVTAAVLADDSVIVRVPAANYGGSAVHFVNGKVESTMTTNNVIKEGTVYSETFINGKLMASMTMDEKTGDVKDGSYVMQGDKKIPVTNGDVETFRMNWRCVRDCLTNIMGVPSWVIGLITAVCALACAATAGAGCIACAQGAVIAYGSEAAFCLGFCD